MARRKVVLIKIGELKNWFHRIFVLALFLITFFTIMLSHVDNIVIEKINRIVLDLSGPVMRVIEMPAQAIHNIYTYFYDLGHIYKDNQILRQENKQMLILQNKVRTLEVENQLLTKLLNYIPPKDASFKSAKIIAQSGDNFTHMLLIYIGNENIKKGQIVLGDESVIGRIDTVGKHYAKVILITDINSKIPVVVERTRVRGILTGDNTSVPHLVYTNDTADIREGDLIVTSGIGGIFPSGLPIGFISKIQNGNIEVETISDISRIEYVRIVDYGISDKQELEINEQQLD